MKKILGVILIVVGVITLPKIISQSGAEVFGGIVGVSLVTFLPAYFLLRTKKKGESVPTTSYPNPPIKKPVVGPAPKETYWESFKKLNPQKAKDIEILTEENFSILSDKDAREKVSSLERWSENSGLSIPNLKQHYLNNFISTFSEDELPDIRESLINEQIKEAGVFSISKQNTGTSYMFKWLEEYMDGLVSNITSNSEIDIFTKAIIGTNYIDENFQKLNFQGYGESILFFCAVIMTETEFKQDIYKYHNIIKKEFPDLFKGFFINEEEIKEFIKSRLSFYDDELDRQRFEMSQYTPLFVYNAFYDKPFTRDVDNLKENLPTMEQLLMFEHYLKRAILYVKQPELLSNT